jgi:hypothetical protein
MDSTLPQDHEDQLQLGIRIIQSAYQNKCSAMEQEIRGLRLTCEEQRTNLSALQKKNSALEVELVEGHQRSQQLAEENKELFKTVGSLRKQIGRLEHLKAAVLTSIQDDAEKEADIGDSRVLLNDDYLRSATPLTSTAMGMPQATYSSASPLSPKQFGGGFTGVGPMPGGMGAEPMAGGSSVDGKAFFRQARSVLSHEAFNNFLQSIKRLNNQQQTREETLAEGRQLFGPDQQGLYADFESLLNRQGL